jgi:hypothetical protein
MAIAVLGQYLGVVTVLQGGRWIAIRHADADARFGVAIMNPSFAASR